MYRNISLAGGGMLLGSSLANQELVSSSLQLTADIRWLQQISANGGNEVSYLLFQHAAPYGYYVTANSQTVKKVSFPASVRLSVLTLPLVFLHRGCLLSGRKVLVCKAAS